MQNTSWLKPHTSYTIFSSNSRQDRQYGNFLNCQTIRHSILYFHRESLEAHFCSVEKRLLLPLSKSEKIFKIKISLSTTDFLFLYLATSISPRGLAHWFLFSLRDSSVSANKPLLNRIPNLPIAAQQTKQTR